MIEQEEIEEMLRKRKNSSSAKQTRAIYRLNFLVLYKSSGFRPIIDLNSYVEHN